MVEIVLQYLQYFQGRWKSERFPSSSTSLIKMPRRNPLGLLVSKPLLVTQSLPGVIVGKKKKYVLSYTGYESISRFDTCEAEGNKINNNNNNNDDVIHLSTIHSDDFGATIEGEIIP
jgi:hypothetical protein